MIDRPADTEYLSFYHRYVSLVPEGDIVVTLAKQNEVTLALLRHLTEPQGGFRYAPGKWSIKELVAHLSDAERIFTIRALRFARADETPLPGFEENDYVRNGSFDRFPLVEIVNGFENLRRSTLSLFRLITPEASLRRGKANNAEISVRALAYVTAGHELHHMNVLRTRYLEHLQAS
ncbi:MAG: DinB family protein [Vicinamibacteria bacterium]